MPKPNANGNQRSETYVLHHAHSLLSLTNKLILRLLNLLAGILAQIIQITVRGGLLARLDRVQSETRVLNVLPRLRCEHQVGVQRGVPASQETGLDLRILGKTGLADLLLSQGILLQRSGERVLHMAALRQGLGAGERRACNRMVEGLGLRLGRGGRGQGGLGFGGGAGLGEEVDLLVDSAAQVVEGFADVGWVVVGLVGVLRANLGESRVSAAASGGG